MLKKLTIVAMSAGILLCAALLFATDTLNEQKLQQGIDLLESKGDLARAMPLFDQASHSSDHAVAVRALLYLGQIQERQGKNNAQATYERIVASFGDQA